MAGLLGGLRGALAGGSPPLLPALAWVQLGLLLTFADGQECPPGMCELPLSTISSAPVVGYNDAPCLSDAQILVIHCRPGFRVLGDNYAVTCRAGDLVPDGNCKVDLFSILVSISATLVGSLVFSLALFVLFECHLRRRRAKARVSGPRRRGHRGRGEGATAGGQDDNTAADDQHSYFSDDEEDILQDQGANHKQEAIYENQQF